MRRALPARALIGVAAVALMGCGPGIERAEDVTGSYVLNQPKVPDVIEVRPDGRYVRSFTPVDGRAVVDSGSWTFEFLDGPRVMFESFHPFPIVAEVGDLVPHADEDLWAALAERALGGGVRLVVSSDLDIAYIRGD